MLFMLLLTCGLFAIAYYVTKQKGGDMAVLKGPANMTDQDKALLDKLRNRSYAWVTKTLKYSTDRHCQPLSTPSWLSIRRCVHRRWRRQQRVRAARRACLSISMRYYSY